MPANSKRFRRLCTCVLCYVTISSNAFLTCSCGVVLCYGRQSQCSVVTFQRPVAMSSLLAFWITTVFSIYKRPIHNWQPGICFCLTWMPYFAHSCYHMTLLLRDRPTRWHLVGPVHAVQCSVVDTLATYSVVPVLKDLTISDIGFLLFFFGISNIGFQTSTFATSAHSFVMVFLLCAKQILVPV
jgi:hypothetical protein